MSRAAHTAGRPGTLIAILAVHLLGCSVPDVPFHERVASPEVRERGRATIWVEPSVAAEHAMLLVYVAQNDPDGAVRFQATTSLGNTGDSRVLPFLEGRLESLYPNERLAAAHALGDLHVPGACPILARAWIRGPDPDPSVEQALDVGFGPFCAPALLPYRESHPDRVEPQLEQVPEHKRSWGPPPGAQP